MYKYWSKKEVSLLKKYYPKLRVKDLVKFLPNRTKATIAAKASALNLPSAKLWQPEENDILQKHFPEAPLNELLKLLPKRSEGAILAQGEKSGLKRNVNKPRRAINESYFRKWSPNMAYLLGFILADGNITKGTYKGYSSALKFGVNSKDVDILKKAKQELSSEHKISFSQKAAYLTITSQRIVDDLKTLRISYRKSLREKVPSVPQRYAHHFIRGIVDGDGSISFDKRGYPKLSICGGKKIVTFIRDYFFFKFNIYSKIGQRTKQKNGNYYLFDISYKTNPAKTLIKHLYANAGLCLERKFKLAKQALNVHMKQRKNYTNKEGRAIKQFYLLLPKDEILSLLPNRSWSGIQQKSRALKIYKHKR